RREAGDERVPVVVAAVVPGIELDRARRTLVVGAVEEAQLEPGAAAREDAEVDAGGGGGPAGGPGRAPGWHGRPRRGGASRGPGELGALRAHVPSARPRTALRGLRGSGMLQMRSAYSRIERSEEKRPTRAQFRTDMRSQRLRSAKTEATRS